MAVAVPLVMTGRSARGTGDVRDLEPGTALFFEALDSRRDPLEPFIRVAAVDPSAQLLGAGLRDAGPLALALRVRR